MQIMAHDQAQEILNKIEELADKVDLTKDKLSGKIDDCNDKVDAFKERLSDKIDNIQDEIGGKDGLRARVTTLESVVNNAVRKGSITPPPPDSSRSPKQSSIKSHAVTAAAGVGGTSVIYMIVEIVNTLLKSK